MTKRKNTDMKNFTVVTYRDHPQLYFNPRMPLENQCL